MREFFSRLKARVASAWARFKAWLTASALAILAALGLVVTAQDQSVTLTWDNATEYSDGSPLPPSEIQSTEVFRATYPVGASPDGSVTPTRIGSAEGSAETYVDANPGNGLHCYRVAHVATNGLQSDLSNEACVTRDSRTPNAPENLSAE